jgi:hypothetical protein
MENTIPHPKLSVKMIHGDFSQHHGQSVSTVQEEPSDARGINKISSFVTTTSFKNPIPYHRETASLI